MRATLSGYYRNLQFDQTKTAKALFDVTKQISSGQKIQYAHEDTTTFVNTVRLDNELTTLTQVKGNATNALQMSRNTDSTMSEMTKILDSMKVKLIAAASEANSPESLKAIAAELRGLENNLVQLANTSVDGKYLFSGSATTTRPIDDNGVYQGNEHDINAFIGSGVKQTYNINGADLFLGDENNIRRKVSLNIPQYNQTLLHSNVMTGVDVAPEYKYIDGNNSIRDLMGDNDSSVDDINDKHNFYIRGTEHDGTSFKSIVTLKDTDSVNALLKKIGEAYGNTPEQDLVSVSLNAHGQIEVLDKLKGSSKLDFHMMASTSISYEPKALATSTGPNTFTFPTVFDNAGTRIPTVRTDDQVYINGERYRVTGVVAPGVLPAAQVDTVTIDTIPTGGAIPSAFIDVEVLKTTGYDLNDNIDNIAANNYEFNVHGVPIKDFMNSNYTQYVESMNQEQDIFNPNKFTLSGDFITKDGEVANKNTLLRDVFSSDVASLEFTGKNSDGLDLAVAVPAVPVSFFDIGATTTIEDLMQAIETTYDPRDAAVPANQVRDVLSVSFEDGKIKIGKRDTFDFTASQSSAAGQNTVNLGSIGQNYTPIVGDEIFFEGDPKPYTIGAPLPVAPSTTYTLTEPLNQNVSAKTKITLSTVRAEEFNIQLEAYSVAGGETAATLAGLGRVAGLPSDSSSTYDEARFMQDKNKLTSDVSQIVRLGATDDDGNDIGNQFAVDSTKLIDVANAKGNTFGLSTGQPNELSFSGIDINGKPFDVFVNLKNDETTITQTNNPPLTDFQAKAYFSVTSGVPAITTEYPIFDVEFTEGLPIDGQFTQGVDTEVLTSGDTMTYKQLNDIINMVATDTLPSDSAATVGNIDFVEYFSAIETSQNKATTALDSKGRIVFEEKNVSSTKAEMTLADTNASDFNADASVLNFNTNNSITISDIKTDFFKQIDEIISSVEEGRIRADGGLDDPRNIGVQNSIQVIDDLSNHMFNQHSIAGVQSQTLQITEDRTDMLIITTKTLRSETLDVDIAEATLTLQQLQLNYQAMLSTVSRMSQLSLVNYL